MNLADRFESPLTLSYIRSNVTPGASNMTINRNDQSANGLKENEQQKKHQF